MAGIAAIGLCDRFRCDHENSNIGFLLRRAGSVPALVLRGGRAGDIALPRHVSGRWALGCVGQVVAEMWT